MSFTALTESQALANMIDTYSALATAVDDMTPGSNIRSIFEAFAMELRRLYQNNQESVAEVQKTAAYTMFKFALLPAQAAYTMETMSVPIAPASDVVVPAGTTVGVPGTTIQFKTPGVTTWPKGQLSQDFRVVCTQVGTIGNRRAGEISQLVTPISGLNNVSVTNMRDIRTGRDVETEDQRANRFTEFLNSLHRGDTRAIPYGAKQTKILDQYGYIAEQVTKAQLVEGVGSNTVYIDNGYYNPSDELVQLCQQTMDGYVDNSGAFIIGYKAAGVPTTVQKCSYSYLSISVSVSAKKGYTFAMIQQSVIDSITTLVGSLDIGKPLLVNDLNSAIGSTPGVLNFSTNISADVTPTDGTLLKLDIGQPVVSSM